tara:strand:- start:614 stop:1702 length:1089 start_codon:yes stop_codon:yes gene_type:complete
MIKDTKLKKTIKKVVIALNIILGVALFCAIVFWFALVQPRQIDRATKLGQYRAYSIDELPFDTGETQTIYANAQEVTGNTEEIDLIERELAEIDSASNIVKNAQPDLLDKADELLARNEIVEHSSEDFSAPLVKKRRQYKGVPKIAIIVTNLGLNRRSTELAMTLPQQCGLGFLPYTKSLKPLLHKAQSNGHEIFLYLPLQTSQSFDNPGRYALMDNLVPEENAVRLNSILNSQARYDGVYSSYKEIFTDNPQSSKMVFEHLDNKNLIFVLGKGMKSGIPRHIKSYNNIIPTNIIIDEEPDKEAITKQLAELVRQAEYDGIALGYAQGFTLTIEMIRNWIPALKKKNINLVPVSEILKEYNL